MHNSQKKDEEKEYFYTNCIRQIEKVSEPIPKYDIQVNKGNLNAKIGEEKRFRNMARKHAIHDNTNDNGTSYVKIV